MQLTSHPQPALRALACTWIAELGTPEWCEALTGVLDDESPEVALAALRARLTLDPSSFGAAFGACERKSWRAANYRACVRWLADDASRLDRFGERGLSPVAALPAPELHALAADAVEAANTATPAEWSDASVPSILERIIAEAHTRGVVPDQGRLSNAWLRKRARACTGPLQAALYRTLARRGAADIAADLEPLLDQDGSPEALLAAEILPTIRSSIPAARILQIWCAELDVTVHGSDE